ncbi:potassium channel family protein [Rothia sp. CCM 9417]|uniref:potassium channel family protein n=1 Tax=unclassified Rothia (in: high G+C Gram-positive bacteria) TaxID=2689056 RepID=UPI003AD2A477
MVSKKKLSFFSPELVSERKSVAVIGLGRFGQSVALELMEDGAEVLGIDSDPGVVQQLNGRLSHVVRADATQEEALEQLDILDFDRIVVAIGNHLESSILVTSYLIRQGVKNIWAKAVSDQHGIILQQLGVEKVVFPERDMGKRVAHLLQGSLKEYIQIDSNCVAVLSAAPQGFVGKEIYTRSLLKEHGIAVTAVRDSKGTWHHLPDNFPVESNDTILFSGTPQAVEQFARNYLQ